MGILQSVHFLSALMVVLFTSPLFAAQWTIAASGQCDTLLALSIDSVDYLFVDAVAKSAGLSVIADPLGGTAAVCDPASRADLRLGSSFYRCDDELRPLSYRVRRNGARMYVACADLSALLSFVKGDTVAVMPLMPENRSTSANNKKVDVAAVSQSVPAVEPKSLRQDSLQTIPAVDSGTDAVSLSRQTVSPPGTKKTAAVASVNASAGAPALSVDEPSGTSAAAPAKSTTKKPRLRTVVIDPGHGGKDPGAVGPTGAYEKDIVLAIGLNLRDMLKANGITVLMTRSTDVFVPLRERTEFANSKNADLFISIHANSIGGPQAKRDDIDGYKIYFLSQAKSDDDKRVAMLENAVVELEDRKGGSHLDNILFDMANNEHLTESQDMSIYMADAIDAATDAVARYQKGVGQANFWVLNGAWMPSVLVETCFISNRKEEKLLTTKSFQKKFAQSLCSAVLRFKKKYGA